MRYQDSILKIHGKRGYITPLPRTHRAPVKPLDGEAAGERIARARRRRGLSQAVLAGLVGRSESWLSQVERGKRDIDSHSVLTRLAEILRVDVAEITGPDPGITHAEHAYPAAPLIELAMLGYGAPGEAALGQPRRHWREAYLITGAAGHWIAHRRDNGRMLAASSPGELRELIIEDYAGQQVPRGTERRARSMRSTSSTGRVTGPALKSRTGAAATPTA